MAGQRRLNGDLRRLKIADFADHDDVRVLAQDRAQGVRKGQADVRMDLDLVDAGELVLDRVLDGKQLSVRAMEGFENRIKRRGLAATGWPGDQDDTVRFVRSE